MSKKMQLPDELLDMVSGGTLTFGGQPVTDFTICTDGFEITTAKGTEGIKFNESFQKAYDSDDGQFDKLISGLETLHNDSGNYSLEDLLGIQ